MEVRIRFFFGLFFYARELTCVGILVENIPVYGPVVADMIRKRLTQPASEVEP